MWSARNLAVCRISCRLCGPQDFLRSVDPAHHCEIVSNINNTFANEFYVKDKDIDELSVRIHDSGGLPFANNKGNNFIIILSY